MKFIKLIRPKQWFKSSFVLAPLIFSGLFSLELFLVSTKYIFIFILISSCIYIFNDMMDLEYDKQHPEKIKRPLASGDISFSEASFYLALLLSF